MWTVDSEKGAGAEFKNAGLAAIETSGVGLAQGPELTNRARQTVLPVSG